LLLQERRQKSIKGGHRRSLHFKRNRLDRQEIVHHCGLQKLDPHGANGKGQRDIAIEKLRQVGLGPEVANLYPAELSGGMQKRVGLARAIAADPEIIFFDEPTTGLDPIMADVINNLIVDCVKRLGATTISITHDMASVRKIADEVAMLHEGRIIWRGPVSALDNSGNPHIDQFVNGRAEGPIQPAI
jgi:phospholipid/cholesterol/gamma-HCH transport system ATP-binding protein